MKPRHRRTGPAAGLDGPKLLPPDRGEVSAALHYFPGDERATETRGGLIGLLQHVLCAGEVLQLAAAMSARAAPTRVRARSSGAPNRPSISAAVAK